MDCILLVLDYLNFKFFIKFSFKIVSLNDIRNGNIKSKINFFISFDDVPTISTQAFNWLNKKNTLRNLSKY